MKLYFMEICPMRCLGRTQALRRCKREGSGRHYPFCHDHRWQPVAAAVSVLGLIVLVAEFRSEVWERYVAPDAVAQRNALTEMCSLLPDIGSTFGAMAAEIRMREGPGRSENREILNDQLARLNSAARRTGNPKLIEASRTTRTKWIEVFGAAPIKNLEKDSPTALKQRFDRALEAMQAMAVIGEECEAQGLSVPSTSARASESGFTFKRSREGLINLLASNEVDTPLELSEELVLAQQMISRMPEAQGLRASLNRCCERSGTCDTLSGASESCMKVNKSPFVVIAIDSNYYLGGKVLTVLFKNPPHAIYFAWMKEGRLVAMQEFDLSDEEKHILLQYYRKAIEAPGIGI